MTLFTPEAERGMASFLDELKTREEAILELATRKAAAGNDLEAARLAGKAQGVSLVTLLIRKRLETLKREGK